MTTKSEWAETISRMRVPTALSLTGPYFLAPETNAVVAADGEVLVTACAPAAAWRMLVAANRLDEINVTLSAIRGVAELNGIDIDAAMAKRIGPTPGQLVEFDSRSGAFAHTDGVETCWLVPGDGARATDRDLAMHDWSFGGEEIARGFRSLGDAVALERALNRLARLNEAVLLLKAKGAGAMTPSMATAIELAYRIVREAVPPDARAKFEAKLRLICPERPYGPNGFLNPHFELYGVDETQVSVSSIATSDGSGSAHRIAFAWKQGLSPEWHIEFKDEALRDRAAQDIFQRFAAPEDVAMAGRDIAELLEARGFSPGDHGYPAALREVVEAKEALGRGEFCRDGLTIRPDMVADLLPEEARIVFTPTCRASQLAMQALGADCFHGQEVTVAPADVKAMLEHPIGAPATPGAFRDRLDEVGAARVKRHVVQTVPDNVSGTERRSPSSTLLFRKEGLIVIDHREHGVEVRVLPGNDKHARPTVRRFHGTEGDKIRLFFRSRAEDRAAILAELRLERELARAPEASPPAVAPVEEPSPSGPRF